MEEWREITGYDGQYLVSNLGRVKSIGNNKNRHEKILKPGHRRGGYLCVNLKKENKDKVVSVHRLVAMAFPEICGEWYERAVCHHLNEIRTDNRPENLRWVTNKTNSNAGTKRQRMSEKMLNHPGISKKVQQYDLDGNLIAVYPSLKEAERQTGVCATGIGACARGNKWCKTSGGYIWKFEK